MLPKFRFFFFDNGVLIISHAFHFTTLIHRAATDVFFFGIQFWAFSMSHFTSSLDQHHYCTIYDYICSFPCTDYDDCPDMRSRPLFLIFRRPRRTYTASLFLPRYYTASIINHPNYICVLIEFFEFTWEPRSG